MINRLCRKCSVRIPSRVVIDGREHTINKRKFCLSCSPFGSHNTRKDLSKPNRPRSYAEYPLELRRKHSKELLARARRLRLEMISNLGGCCSKCGYSKYAGALAFHHKDPKSKLFSLGSANLRAKKREIILAEVAKCELLCMNCHSEHHYYEHNF